MRRAEPATRFRSHGIREDDGETTEEVSFRPLDDATIETCLARVHTLDKAGGYAIQEHGDLLVDSRRGSLSNVIGFPLDTLKTLLSRHGLFPAQADR